MSVRPARDEWLLPTLETMVGEEAIAELRGAVQDSYWEAAIRGRLVRDDALLAALAARFRMKVADLSRVSQQARELVPEQLARKYRVLPLAISDSVLDVATSDPHDLDCERTLAFATGRTVRMSLGSPDHIAARLDEIYRPESAVEKLLEGVAGNYDVESLRDDDDAGPGLDAAAARAGDRPIVRLVDHIVAEAIASRASDIHLEPEEGGVAVRYRIDGVLRQVMVIPRGAGWPLVSRIKIMAELDIADRMRPQDGRARIAVNGTRVDLRVSTLPASHGEKVVIRILDQRATLLSLDSLGLGAEEIARVRRLLAAREGIVLVTGPTGSGKTTTLYSALRQIQNGGVNIVTVEDPVEYRLQGIVQVQVNEKAGLTFAAALRSILRQDPDVVLVGEIRDQETAQVAVQASLTGHLVFSTLHTNDAVSSVTRLADIGIEPYKVASALKGVVAQRLLRKLCRACRERATDPVPARLGRWAPAAAELYRPVGCAECSNTGYRGRLAIVEVLVSTPEVERRIAAGESADRIALAARQGGMRTLWDSGLDHVLAGETSVDELLRVVEMPAEPTPGTATPPRGAPSSAARNGRGGVVREPAAPSAASAIGATEALTGERAFELLDGLGGDGEGPDVPVRVLLVEDEAPLRGALRDLLERQGFQVEEAGDGVQALDAVDRAAPSVVVLDLSLPRLDGFDVLERLRARASTARLPVIVLTGDGDEESEVRVFELGADDYLVKPFRPRALGARLRALLRRRDEPADV
ncbi:MAG: ATPase, T2SS/T4P/T4SS family [Gemmatimonadaceae bacterium]